MAGEDFIAKIIDFTSSTIIGQNVAKLYALLYPYMVQDFRHKEDCKIAMDIMDQHTHMHTDSTIFTSIQLPTQPPIVKAAIQDAIGFSLVGVDTQTGLPAQVGASVVIKPFQVT